MSAGKQHVKIELRGAKGRRLQANLSVGTLAVIGSDTRCDVVVEGEDVADQHATLTAYEAGVGIVPIGDAVVSVNGEVATNQIVMRDRDWVALGTEQFQIRYVSTLADSHPPARLDGHSNTVPPTTTRQPSANATAATPPRTEFVIGRSDQAALSLDHPLVAKHHARVHATATGKYVLLDEGTPVGTFVNGIRVQGQHPLQAGDIVHIAGFPLQFNGSAISRVDADRGVRIEAMDLGCRSSIRDTAGVELQGISLVIRPGECVAIVSSDIGYANELVRTLCNKSQIITGELMLDRSPAGLQQQALTPLLAHIQADVPAVALLSAEREIYFASMLRLPRDTSNQEANAHRMRVLVQTQPKAISESTRFPNNALRAELAAELLTKPRGLFVDGPAAAAPPAYDKALFRLLREVATTGCTCIAATTREVEAHETDLVVYLHAGRLVYFGPPGHAAHYFGSTKRETVLEQLRLAPIEQWEQAYRVSHYFKTYVQSRQAAELLPRTCTPSEADTPVREQWQLTPLLKPLLARQIEGRLNNKRKLLHDLILPLLLGIGGGIAVRMQGLTAATWSSLFFNIALCWGMLNAAGEFWFDARKFERERCFGLTAAMWTLSKLLIPAVGTVIQINLCLASFAVIAPAPSYWGLQSLVLMTTTAIAACGLGQLVAAATLKLRQRYRWACLALIMVLDITLSRLALTIGGKMQIATGMFSSSYWGVRASQAVLQSAIDASHYLGGVTMQTVMGIGFVALAIQCLANHRPTHFVQPSRDNELA